MTVFRLVLMNMTLGILIHPTPIIISYLIFMSRMPLGDFGFEKRNYINLPRIEMYLPTTSLFQCTIDHYF